MINDLVKHEIGLLPQFKTRPHLKPFKPRWDSLSRCKRRQCDLSRLRLSSLEAACPTTAWIKMTPFCSKKWQIPQCIANSMAKMKISHGVQSFEMTPHCADNFSKHTLH